MAGREELGGEPAEAGLRAGAALEGVGQSWSGSAAASARGLPDSRLPASQREHSGWQSRDCGAGHGDFPGPHQPTPALHYFLCPSRLRSYMAEETRGSSGGRHPGNSLHQVKPNVNSWGRLAAEGGGHLVREQEEQEDRELGEKPGWVVSHSQRSYRAG